MCPPIPYYLCVHNNDLLLVTKGFFFKKGQYYPVDFKNASFRRQDPARVDDSIAAAAASDESTAAASDESTAAASDESDEESTTDVEKPEYRKLKKEKTEEKIEDSEKQPAFMFSALSKAARVSRFP